MPRQDEVSAVREGRGLMVSALPYAFIHPMSGKVNSANFVLMGF